jgi:hypothetical protein
MLETKHILISPILSNFTLTIVAALKAEPKSIPITCPDDVSIRKLNKKNLNKKGSFNLSYTSIDVDLQFQVYNDLYIKLRNL